MTKLRVLIIGGGIMGTASALELAKSGASVLVLEKAIPGAEASTAAAGILGAQLEVHPPSEPDVDGQVIEIPEENKMSVHSREMYADFARTLTESTGIDIGYRRCGGMKVAFTQEELNALGQIAKWQKNRGLAVQELSREELLQIEPELGQTLGGVRFVEDGQVDTRALFKALQVACTKAGVEFKTGAHVRRVKIEQEKACGVILEDGTTLLADKVILAAGSWSTLIEGVPLQADVVKPARGQMVELSLRAPCFNHVIFGAGGYVVPRQDGRVLVGSTLEFVGFHKDVTARGMRDLLTTATKLIPALQDASVSGYWSSFRPFSTMGRPVIGASPLPGLIFATGHHRNGILLAPVTAAMVKEAVLS